jgi:hypothetical protein
MSFLDKAKKASKGVIDAGAKTMLKVSSSSRMVRRAYQGRATDVLRLPTTLSLRIVFFATTD